MESRKQVFCCKSEFQLAVIDWTYAMGGGKERDNKATGRRKYCT